MNYEQKFPNGFNSWRNTYFEVSGQLNHIINEGDDTWPSRIELIDKMQGRDGIYQLAEKYTDIFEQQYKDKEWNGEFYDVVEEFVIELINNE
jgi:hypothetical protein